MEKYMEKRTFLSRYAAGERNFEGIKVLDTALSGIDLSGINLSKANLSAFDLSGANLSSADLRRIKMLGANLSGANLQGADLPILQKWRSHFKVIKLCAADLEVFSLPFGEFFE